MFHNCLALKPVSNARKEAFDEEFMKQFEKEHAEAFPEGDVALDVGGGNPDQGNGWYC